MGLWIAKTGEANAWYHIFPFVAARRTDALHVVRHALPQIPIDDDRVRYHLFKGRPVFLEHIRFFLRGVGVMRNETIDYVVSFNLVPWGAIAWLVAKLFRKPVIIGLIGNDFNRYIDRSGYHPFQSVLKRADLITVTGKRMRDILRQKGYVQPIHVFPHCLGPSFFEPDPSRAREWDLVSVSSLIERKRTVDIVTAVGLLKQEGLRVTLNIIGDGPKRGEIEAEIAKYGLQDQVQLLGYRTDVLEQVSDAKVFVQASTKEGLSLSLVEAMGAALVPVATEAGTERDLIEDGVNGRMVPVKNPRALADAIQNTLEPVAYASLMDGVLKTRAHLHIDHAIEETDRILDDLLPRHD